MLKFFNLNFYWIYSYEKNDDKKINEFNYKYEEILKELKNIEIDI